MLRRLIEPHHGVLQDPSFHPYCGHGHAHHWRGERLHGGERTSGVPVLHVDGSRSAVDSGCTFSAAAVLLLLCSTTIGSIFVDTSAPWGALLCRRAVSDIVQL